MLNVSPCVVTACAKEADREGRYDGIMDGNDLYEPGSSPFRGGHSIGYYVVHGVVRLGIGVR
jgi:hypothetical protein